MGEAVKCPNCGATIAVDKNICRKCGCRRTVNENFCETPGCKNYHKTGIFEHDDYYCDECEKPTTYGIKVNEALGR